MLYPRLAAKQQNQKMQHKLKKSTMFVLPRSVAWFLTAQEKIQ
jgi:hypothetical protein